MPEFRHFNVPHLYEEEIAQTARAIRAKYCPAHPYLDVCGLALALSERRTGGFQLGTCPPENIGNAYGMSFWEPVPTTLISAAVWLHAEEEGCPWARFVVAHELGHQVLHRDRYAKLAAKLPNDFEYLNDRRELGDGRCGEWQANTFAMHLLAPDHMAGLCASAHDLRQTFGLPSPIAAIRFERSRYIRSRRIPPFIEERLIELRRRAGRA